MEKEDNGNEVIKISGGIKQPNGLEVEVDIAALQERMLDIRDKIRPFAAAAGFAWFVVEVYPFKVHPTHYTQEEQKSADVTVQPLNEVPIEVVENYRVKDKVEESLTQQETPKRKKMPKLTQRSKNEEVLPCCDWNTNTRGMCTSCSNDSSAPRLLRSKIVVEETPPPKPPRLLRYRHGMDE